MNAEDARERLAERLEDAELPVDRFINVHDGEKASTNHTRRGPGEVTGNYGIYAGDGLVLVDVDDYGDLDDKSGLHALHDLPATLEQQSPHGGTHRLYRVDVDDDSGRTVAEVLDETVGAKNPGPSWGEVRVENQYVVGAGSQLDGCDKEWCDECATDEGGWYTLGSDVEIATVTAAELVGVLQRDPAYAPDDEDDEGEIDAPGLGEDADAEEILTYALEESNDEKLQRLYRGDYSDYRTSDGVDRSKAEAALVRKLAFWLGGDRQAVERAMNDASTKKWDERGEGYRSSTLDLIDDVTEFYDPSTSGRPASSPDPHGDGDDVELPSPDTSLSWADVRQAYEHGEGKGDGRLYASRLLRQRYDWMYVEQSQKLWTYNADSGYFEPRGEEELGRLLEENLGAHYSRTERMEVYDRIIHDGRVQTDRDELNARKDGRDLVCVANGVVDMETGELHDHDPAYRFTRGLDVEHDPGAVPERVLRFLRSVTKRDEDMWTLLQQLGHGLMPGHPYKAFVVMYGGGDNGKTAVSELFRAFVGSKNAAAVELSDFQEDSFATGQLPGKMINVGDDLSGAKVKDVSMLKRLTGDAALRSNEKYEKEFTFQNEAAMFFSGNEPPVFAEQTDAVKGRLYPIHMPHKFTQEDDEHPDADPRLVERITADPEEMSGLLNLAIQGAQELIRSGGHFAMPEGADERMRMYEAASDPIRRFIIDYTEQGGGDDVVLKDDAFDAYAAMCRAQGERSTSPNVFKGEVTSQAVRDVESTRTRKFSADGQEQEPAWKYLRFTEDAREHMSDRLQRRYFGSAEGGSDDATASTTPTAEENAGAFADVRPGYIDFKATLVELLDGPDWIEGKGHFKDDEGNFLPFVLEVPGVLANIEEGERVTVRNAKIEEKKGVPTALLSGIADVGTASSQTGLDAADAATDGGALETSGGDESDRSDGAGEESDDDADGGSGDVSAPSDGEGSNPRKDAREVAELLGDATMSKVELANAAADELGFNAGNAIDLIQLAHKKYGYVEQLDGGEYRQL